MKEIVDELVKNTDNDTIVWEDCNDGDFATKYKNLRFWASKSKRIYLNSKKLIYLEDSHKIYNAIEQSIKRRENKELEKVKEILQAPPVPPTPPNYWKIAFLVLFVVLVLSHIQSSIFWGVVISIGLISGFFYYDNKRRGL